MLARQWSTDIVPAEGRFAYWRSAVCDGIVGAETENPGNGEFFARLSVARAADFGFATFAARGHDVLRPARKIGGADAAPFLLTLQLAGESRYGQGRGALVAREGEITLVNTARPFRVSFPGEVSRVIAILPRALVRMRIPGCDDVTKLKVDGAAPGTDLVRAHLVAAARAGAELDQRSAAVLVDNVVNLLALVLAPTSLPSRAEARRDALLAYVARNLADPALSPRHAADALGISLRLVHRLFAERGTTFGRWMLERRLEACRRCLDDPAGARSISDIAFGWGFNELSHFSRAFKARYGLSPREYRARGR